MAILSQEDTNADSQVTIEDTGPKTIRLGTLQSGGIVKAPIHGTYMISSLLQELAMQGEPLHSSATSSGHMVINEAKLRENPVERLRRMITDRFWPALVRQLDADGLQLALVDPKNRTRQQRPRIYVPFEDKLAQDYYNQLAHTKPSLDLEVVVLPKEITPIYVASIRDKPGILSLSLTVIHDLEGNDKIQGTPFVVPGGRFNEMYGWDSYFCALGLLEQPDSTGYYLYLAKSLIDNFAYEINHYGKILNANRSYYLCRSQPPFLTAMIKAVSEKIDELDLNFKAGRIASTDFVTHLLNGRQKWKQLAFEAAIKEYKQVWMKEPRFVSQYGLSRYYDEGLGIPMETEPSHYESVLKGFAEKWELEVDKFISAYNAGTIKEPELDQYFVHDRALRESGHDTTYRFEGRTADLLTVDLNALLYRYEVDVAEFLDGECAGSMMQEGRQETAQEWRMKAEERKRRMYLLLWDAKRGLWFDYDFVKGEKSDYESVTSFWTMWAGLVSPSDAKTMVDESLPLFDVAGGLVAGTEKSRGPISLLRPSRQWDYPYGWAPHQMLAWQGLLSYGYIEHAKRLAYHWLFMIAKCFAEFNAVVPEKFDVVARSHKVTAEYGNVGTDFKMVPKEGFGWMNASFQVGLSMLNRSERRALELLIPPERLFK